MNLLSVDDLFTTQEERDQKNQEYVKDISIYEITDFPNHPFKVKMDDKMLETIESVRDHGVLVPALVREKPTGGYEMISGHRRKMASELAGKETMPCIVRNLSDDQAVIVMVDSNLQREKILPSERAFAYKMKYEVLKKTGFLDKKWEELLEKAFIDFKKPHYSWLIGRCYTKEERLYAEKIYNEWEKKFLQRFKKVDNVIYI